MTEQHSSPEAHRDTLDRSPFMLENVERFRLATKERYDARYENRFNEAMTQEAVDQDTEQILHEYLAAQGIDNDDERAKYAQVLRDFAYDRISDTDWRYGAWEDKANKKQGPTGPALLHQKQVELFGSELPDTAAELAAKNADRASDEVRRDQDARGLSEALRNSDDSFESLSDEYAKLVAERSKRMIDGANTREDIRDLIEGYTETDDEGKEVHYEGLSDLMSALATQMMVELEAEGLSEDEVLRRVGDFVSERTDSILQKMEDHRIAEYNKARPAMQRFYDKWEQWSNEKGFLTKGKLKKMTIIAVPSAAAGVVLMPLAGAIGAGAGIGAAGFMVGRSVIRRLAGAKLDNIARVKTVAGEDRIDIKHRIDAAAANPVEHSDEPYEGEGKNLELFDIINERSEAYRKHNLKRTFGGVAIAMTVGLVSGTAADALSGSIDHWSFGKIGEKLDDWFGGNGHKDVQGSGTQPNSPEGPRIPEPTGPPANPEELSRNDIFDGYHATRELTPDGRDAVLGNLDGHVVKPGDTIWDLSEQALHEQGIAHPTVYEIDATKDVLLQELRESGQADAHGWLSVGDTIKLK